MFSCTCINNPTLIVESCWYNIIYPQVLSVSFLKDKGGGGGWGRESSNLSVFSCTCINNPTLIVESCWYNIIYRQVLSVSFLKDKGGVGKGE